MSGQIISIGRTTAVPDIILYPNQREGLREAYISMVKEIVKHAPGVELVTADIDMDEKGHVRLRTDLEVKPLRACMCDGGGGIAHIRSDRCTSGS